jgi:hypothetical protein
MPTKWGGYVIRAQKTLEQREREAMAWRRTQRRRARRSRKVG